MTIHETFETYGPSKDLWFRLRKLQEIAAAAIIMNHVELYNQAKSLYDQMICEYNSQAETKKKGFWEKFFDNLTWTSSSVTILNELENSPEFNDLVTYYREMSKINHLFLPQQLKKSIDEWKLGRDLLSAYGF